MSATIPNALSITIHTTIPGYQSITFKHNMIDQKIDKDKKIVYFNPLVKLDKNVISKVPKNLQISEFFQKAYFSSLVNFHGIKSNITL